MLGTLTLVSVISLQAALQAAPAPETADHLQPLQFLVGHCWAGAFPNNGGTDTHCFEPMFGGKFIRDKHVVHSKGPDYLGESIYAFDPKQQRIVFWYWSSAGVIDGGDVQAVADGLNFPERHMTEPKDVTTRTHWKRTGEDRYEAVNEGKTADGTWRTEWKIEYVRVAK
jgi:hypothetical protein